MFNGVHFRSYDDVRRTNNIPILAERRLDFSRTFFKRIIRDKLNVLWYLLPAKRDVQHTARLHLLDNIQQSTRELIVIKTLSLYMD